MLFDLVSTDKLSPTRSIGTGEGLLFYREITALQRYLCNYSLEFLLLLFQAKIGPIEDLVSIFIRRGSRRCVVVIF
jgi:hypothetical protein